MPPKNTTSTLQVNERRIVKANREKFPCTEMTPDDQQSAQDSPAAHETPPTANKKRDTSLGLKCVESESMSQKHTSFTSQADRKIVKPDLRFCHKAAGQTTPADSAGAAASHPTDASPFDPEGTFPFVPEGAFPFDPEGAFPFDPKGAFPFDPEDAAPFDPKNPLPSFGHLTLFDPPQGTLPAPAQPSSSAALTTNEGDGWDINDKFTNLGPHFSRN